jgi:hypothetical protein
MCDGKDAESDVVGGQNRCDGPLGKLPANFLGNYFPSPIPANYQLLAATLEYLAEPGQICGR